MDFYHILFIISCQGDLNQTDDKIIYFDPPQDETLKIEQVLTPVDSFSFHFGSDTGRFVPGVFMLKVNSKDEIFIVNDNRIARFTNKGHFISDFGGKGKGPGEFLYLVDLKIDEKDNVWFYDIGQKRMTIFENRNGSYHYSIHRYSLELEPLQQIRTQSDQTVSFRFSPRDNSISCSTRSI